MLMTGRICLIIIGDYFLYSTFYHNIIITVLDIKWWTDDNVFHRCFIHDFLCSRSQTEEDTSVLGFVWIPNVSVLYTGNEIILFPWHAGSKKPIRAIYLNNLVPHLRDLSEFYSYKGSLTTPPCYQSVKWIVLKRPIRASEYVVWRFLLPNHD